ncbi:growth hormone-regulated TBC protein 1-A [Salvelinus sp. IW2-2015]|uniref:growth hormone-regulated TBC protein 1-A n=1 Tax=Salvelinus sp. IW2-2015 TaxID=2691554 RepID=UPI000CDFE33D|nr:growth hormone-regulated TBC protein 1-A [Salvelinus alpinus]
MESETNGNISITSQLHLNNSTNANDRVDSYGFEMPEGYESYEKMMAEYVAVLTRRSFKWSKLLQGKVHVEKNLKVKRYVRKGVPNEHRAQIWMAASGAQEQLEKNPGYYHTLLGTEQQHDAKLEETVRIDMHRTFPDNVQFRNSSEPCLQKALYNVLLAYGHHNQAVGYCQGMNFIAGYLIIITKDEEKSFWLMDSLLGRILSDYYSPGMLGLKTDQEVLGELVRVKAPAVWQAMAQHNVMWTLVVSRWFICLYIDVLPVETVLRIWDCLFYEGSKILFRVALALILHHQAEILQARSMVEVCERFKLITQGAFTYDCHTFMQEIFREPGSLSMATITKLRETCREHIVAEMSRLHP